MGIANKVIDLEARIGEAVEKANEEMKKSIAEEVSPGFQQLKSAAITFLAVVNALTNDLEPIIADENSNFITPAKRIQQYYQLMKKNDQYNKELLKWQLYFEHEVNQFLKREIYLTYVLDSGELLFFDTVGTYSIYESSGRYSSQGRVTKGKINKLSDKVAQLKPQLQEDIKRSVENRKDVYTEAIRRYNKNFTSEHMHYENWKNTFYWWTNSKKEVLGGVSQKISNRGPIAEGYAAAVINQEKNITGSNIEKSLFYLDKYYIGKDNIPAVAKGDVVYKDDGSIQFAVKMGKFSLPLMGQYITLAYNLTQINTITPETLGNVEVIKQLSKDWKSAGTSQLIKIINNKIDITIDEFIKECESKK